MNTDLENLTPHDLLPHKGKMLLIDDIVEISEEAAVSRSRIHEKWPLVENEAVSALLIVELVAQTSGLSNGYSLINKIGKETSKKGWVVGIKKARFHIDQLPVGAQIVTRAVNCYAFDGFVEIEGDARMDGEIVGEVTLQVMKAG